MNVIICSHQGNLHRTIKAQVLPSFVSKLSHVFHLSSETFPSIREIFGVRKVGV